MGTLRAAQDLMDAVLDQRNGPHPAPDLFQQWEALGPEMYNLKVAEATVLARLGGLLHDLCHIPFGHSIEDDLGVLAPHDANPKRFEILWSQLSDELQALVNQDLGRALRHLILSKEMVQDGSKEAEAAARYPFVTDIVGNTICADLLDYLERDHQAMGLPAKLGHRFLDGFYVTRSDALYHPQRMAIKIVRNGQLRSDVITELFKFLRYRYELSERGLVHHTKLAADAMVGKTLEMWNDAIRAEKAVTLSPGLSKRQPADIDELLSRAKSISPDLPQKIQKEAQDELENQFLKHGDDGLLEWLLDWAGSSAASDRRKAGILELAKMLLERRLYKLVGKSSQSSRSMASEIHGKHGGFEQRRRLEEEVARYAGLDHRWQVVLWIPPPQMRLKAADVLIDTDGQVLPLKDYDHTSMQRGKDIYESHEALWAVSVYIHPSIAGDDRKKQVILAWLRKHMGVEWEAATESRTLEQLAAETVATELDLPRSKEQDLAVGISGYKGDKTFEALCKQIVQIAEARSVPAEIQSDDLEDDDQLDELQPNESTKLL
ncbi:MAG: HD domain-containing protein [Dehalococcoidia bacterium]